MEEIIAKCEEKMNKVVEGLKSNFSTIRSGSVSPNILDKLSINYYGERTPIKNVASISCTSATQMLVRPFDPTCTKLIVGAIGESDLGINPIVDGTQIRLNFPALTGERRQELVKVAKEYMEESKIAIRKARQECMDIVKKDKELSKDVAQDLQNEIQKLTDKYNKNVEAMFKTKEKDLLTL